VPRAADAPLLVALDSRRADLYVQLFDAAGGAIGEPAAVLPTDLGRFVTAAIGEAPLLIAGDASEIAAATLGSRRGAMIVPGSEPDALGVLAAWHRRPKLADPAARALYLRPPDVSFPKAHRGGGL
jgi:tRNA threonylcarbamoyladenosine biosynthesis protein TsaB